MRLSDEKSLLEQMTIEQARQNIALLKAEEIEMPKKWVLELLNTIEALQQENNGWRERYDELDAGHSRLFKDFCKLQKENEQLQAQVARMREALTIANNYMPDIGQSDVEALRKAREAIIAWDRVNWCDCDRCKNMRDALATIDKAIGGREDV